MKKIKRVKKYLKRNSILIHNTSRWTLFIAFSFVLGLKIIELVSNETFLLLLSTPNLSEFTKIQDNAFLFFI